MTPLEQYRKFEEFRRRLSELQSEIEKFTDCTHIEKEMFDGALLDHMDTIWPKLSETDILELENE